MSYLGGGLPPTSAYPYRPIARKCNFIQYSSKPGLYMYNTTPAVTMAGFTDIDANDECALLQAVCNQPVTVAVNVRHEA